MFLVSINLDYYICHLDLISDLDMSVCKSVLSVKFELPLPAKVSNEGQVGECEGFWRMQLWHNEL